MTSILDEIRRRDKILGIFHKILDRHGLDVGIGRMDFHLRDKVIVETLDKAAGLSEAVLDHMFPREPAPATLYHYTSFEGLKGIAQSRELRLYPIRKRLGQGGELDAFAKAHGLFGYLDTTTGAPFYHDLSDDLFYISMTLVPPKDPQIMWGAFAKGTGARLQFQIQPGKAELRPIHYERSGSVTILREINDALKADGEPPFIPWTISKIGAFYLKSNVASEDEVRLLVKRYHGGVDLTGGDGAFRYWPIPIGVPNPVCQLDLAEVHVAPGADRAAIEAIFQNSGLSGVTIAGP